MTGSDLFRGIGNISEEYILEAENYSKTAMIGIKDFWTTKVAGNAALRKTMAAAACLIVCFGLVTMVQRLGFGVDSATESIREEAALAGPGASGKGNESASQMLADTTGAAAASVAAGTSDGAEAGGAELMEYAMTESSMAATEAVPETLPEAMIEETVNNAESAKSWDSGLEAEKVEDTENKDIISEKTESEELCGYPPQTTLREEWDVATVKERQAAYPDDYQALLKLENVFLIQHGEVKAGKMLWEDFLTQVDAGETAQIDIIRFTVEGDAIIETVHYDGEIFRLYVDSSRDAFGIAENAYYEAEYKYLQRAEHVLEEGSGTLEYLLTDSEEDISKILASGDEQRQAEVSYYSIVYLEE